MLPRPQNASEDPHGAPPLTNLQIAWKSTAIRHMIAMLRTPGRVHKWMMSGPTRADAR
jgi:hypothetical protein